MKIVLASASPRRKELLGVMGLGEFEIMTAPGEEQDFEGLPPVERVRAIALDKARRSAAAAGEDALVISADTLVFMDGAALGKPRDEAEAYEMLSALSGREHHVATGVAMIYMGREITDAQLTAVRFAKLTEAEIRGYIATGEPMDKAGAYGIQGRGSVLVEHIEGDYFNVMGLPIRKVYSMLEKFGISLL